MPACEPSNSILRGVLAATPLRQCEIRYRSGYITQDCVVAGIRWARGSACIQGAQVCQSKVRTSNNVTVIDAAPSDFTRHSTSVAMAGGNFTSLSNPTLALTVSGAYSPTDPAVRTVYHRVNDSQGAFTAASGSGPYSATLSGLSLGLNYVSLFAVDAMEGTSINTAGGGGGGTSSMIGAPSVFAFTWVINEQVFANGFEN